MFLGLSGGKSALMHIIAKLDNYKKSTFSPQKLDL